MHTVALRTESSLPVSDSPAGQFNAYKVDKVISFLWFSEFSLKYCWCNLSWWIEESYNVSILFTWKLYQLLLYSLVISFVYPFLINIFLPEPNGWNVCFPCHYHGKYSSDSNDCLHKNRLHGHTLKPLSSILNNICIYQRVSTTYCDTRNILLVW